MAGEGQQQDLVQRPAAPASSSSASSESPPAILTLPAATKRWATADDWSKYREIITKLYKQDGRGLRDVMQIMGDEHAFFASPKMYKDRLKKWGVTKNAPHGSHRRALFVHRQKQQEHQKQLLQGRQAGRKQQDFEFKSENDNNSDDSDDVIDIVPDSRHWFKPTLDPRTRITFLEGSLDGYKAFQSNLWGMHGLMAQARAQGIALPSATQLYEADSIDWAAQLATGTVLIRNQKHAQGFKLLGDCLDRLGRHIGNGDSGAVQSVLNLGLGAYFMSTVSHELYTTYFSFASRLIAMRVGTRHPLYRICESFLRMGPQTFLGHATGLGVGFIDIISMLYGDEITVSQRAALILTQGWTAGICYMNLADYQDDLLGNKPLPPTLDVDPIWNQGTAMGERGDLMKETEWDVQKLIVPRVVKENDKGMRFVSFIPFDPYQGVSGSGKQPVVHKHKRPCPPDLT